MKKLSLNEKIEIQELIETDNRRIAAAQFFGDQTSSVNAKRAKHLKPSVLAGLYKVTPAQIRTAAKGLL